MNEQYKAQLITQDNKDLILAQNNLTPSEKGFIQLCLDKGLILGREIGIEHRGRTKFPDFAVMNPRRHDVMLNTLPRAKDGNILIDKGDERWCILELTVTPAYSLRADSPFVQDSSNEHPKRQQLRAMRTVRTRWGFLTYENLLHMQTYSGYTFFSDDSDSVHRIHQNCYGYIDECRLLRYYPRLGNNRGLKLMPRNVSGAEWKNRSKPTFDELSSSLEEKKIHAIANLFMTKVGMKLVNNSNELLLLDNKILLERHYSILRKLFNEHGGEQCVKATTEESMIKPLGCVNRVYNSVNKYEEIQLVNSPDTIYEESCGYCWFGERCYAKKVMEGHQPPTNGVSKEMLQFYEPLMTECQSVYNLLTNIANRLSNAEWNQNHIAQEIFFDEQENLKEDMIKSKSKFVSRLVELIEQDLVNIIGLDGYEYMKQRNTEQRLSRVEAYQSLNQKVCSLWLRFQQSKRYSSGFHGFVQRWYYFTKYGIEPQNITQQFKSNWNLENIRNLMCNKDYRRQGKTVREMEEKFKVVC